jgi:hypothetical protein
MEERFHINPETGEVGACKAWLRPCPFEKHSEHFTTEDEAHSAVEKAYRGIPLAIFSNKIADKISLSSMESFLPHFPRTDAERESGDRLTYRDGRHEEFQRAIKVIPPQTLISLNAG